MPDWFYRTVSRPILFRLPATRARNFALGFMGRLARLPLGPYVIDFLGHMRPDPRLKQSLFGIDFATAVGLGPLLDGEAIALPALARFGFGFLEVGPVSVTGNPGAKPIERLPDREAIWLPEPEHSLSLAQALPKVVEASRLKLPLLIRLAASVDGSADRTIEELQELIRALGPYARMFSLPAQASRAAGCESLSKLSGGPLLLRLPADADPAAATPCIEAGLRVGIAGLQIDGSVANSPGRLVGAPARGPALDLVRALCRQFGPQVPIIASGGIHEPKDALDFREAGADLIQVDTGLVFSGPGLPKRINEAFLFEATRHVRSGMEPARAAEQSWFWLFLMGAGMLFGSILALIIAATRVVLPYDEAFTGLSRTQLAEINSRLLAFMSHDRISLAGSMIAVGAMYVGLAFFGVRRGLSWARISIIASALVGFASFFLFLGFGYLDPFHAFVAAALFQFFLLGVHSRPSTHVPSVRPVLTNSRAWLMAQWGQLLLIGHAVALLAAGVAISTIGVTRVFVPEDLQFMHTTADLLHSAHPRLVPLIAHDRATFGGMLLSSGVLFLLPALWGFRNGRAWLWWTMFLSGIAAYACAIGVHFVVGYMHLTHLAPAFAGLGWFLIALALSYPYLCDRGDEAGARSG